MAALVVLLSHWLFHGLGVLASYVTNSSVFPQPLSAEEEAELLARKMQGDEEARNILIERNLRLVAHIVKKFDNTGEDAEDLISIGTIGLIKAINTFDPGKKTRLATYAARCIENDISMTQGGVFSFMDYLATGCINRQTKRRSGWESPDELRAEFPDHRHQSYTCLLAGQPQSRQRHLQIPHIC